MRKLATAIAAMALIYFFATHRSDSNASGCVRSPSPDALYVAEECLLAWDHGDNPEYVGRVYDASGKLIVRRSLHTPVPEITWIGNYLLFQRGGDEEDMVTFPLSLYDSIVATYWRLTQW